VFDVGFWEMSLIALIALIVLGPERLPKLARTVGLWVGRARRMVADVKADIDREVRNSELKEMEQVKKDVENVGRSFRSSLDKASESMADEGRDLDLTDAIRGSAPDASSSKVAPAKKSDGAD
jgi:sec-independent protein translocase protein TatB